VNKVEQMPTARLSTFIGLGLLTMAVLIQEITLTRIFSVTLWYHFAFLVISLALLGSGASGVWIFLAPRQFREDRVPNLLPWLALGYALSVLVAFAVYQQVPLSVDDLRDGLTTSEVGWLAFIYAELTVPFIFAGAATALALRQYQEQAGRMYFADLLGASAGCVLAVVALNELGGPGALLLTAVLGTAGGFLLSLQGATRFTQGALGALLVLGLVGFGLQTNDPWLTLKLRKTYNNDTPIYEGWNAHSRITVYRDPWLIPFGWGISQKYFQGEQHNPGHYMIMIDEKAGTPIQHHNWNNGDEDWDSVDFLAYDVTALPYYLREDADVFIVGPGGGRDVLTALRFNANHVVGVELNQMIVDLVTYDFADYAGHIYSRPNVDIHVDDARTYLAAHDNEFDVIQASLIDTFAASSAGAFALSENGIYTVEAFQEYYDHLKEDGIVNFSRWYYAEGPAETLRLVSVGLKAWENRGVESPEENIIVLANMTPDRIVDEGLAGMLIKKTPFTPEEVQRVTDLAEEMDFAVLYAPGVTDANASPVADFILTDDREAFVDDYPLDISPATDNRPFFFSVVRLSDLDKDEFLKSAIYGFGAEATRTLLATLFITIVLTFVLVILPLVFRQGGALREYAGGGKFILYYAMLGLGFILVEIPMLQKLNIYMGNPTYALAVVLFAILLFSGIGSFLTQSVPASRMLSNLRGSLAVLLVVIIGYMVLLTPLLNATQGFQLELRAVVVVLALAPLGLLMGRPFPLGLRYVDAAGARGLMPWLWAANGTFSVVGSVSATLIAIQFGFTAALMVGLIAYALALLMAGLFQNTAANVSTPAAKI
jgi:SAM-dependent methyltransferase